MSGISPIIGAADGGWFSAIRGFWTTTAGVVVVTGIVAILAVSLV